MTGMRELTSSLPPKEGTENSWWSVTGGGVADKEREEMYVGENLGKSLECHGISMSVNEKYVITKIIVQDILLHNRNEMQHNRGLQS